MSKSWTDKEMQLASQQMKKQGHLSYEEFTNYISKATKEDSKNPNKG